MAVPVPPPPTPPQPDLAGLEAKLATLEERVKENQTSIFAAIKTLLHDVKEFREGKRDFNSLQPAALGLLFAYLRPRLVIIVGSMLAALMGGAQLWFLWIQQKQIDQQNRLIEQQGHFLREQTRANQVSAVSELVLALDPAQPTRSQLAQVQLAEFGEAGAAVLMKLSEAAGPASALAAGALYGQGDIHSAAQAGEVLSHWVETSTRELAMRAQAPGGAQADTAASFLRMTRPHIRQYVWDLVFRVENDAAFRGQLRSELLNRKPPPARDELPRALAGLYLTYARACEARSLPGCYEPGRASRVPVAPPWHTEVHYLASRLAPAVRGQDAATTYRDLFAGGTADPARVHRTIAGWFQGPGPAAGPGPRK